MEKPEIKISVRNLVEFIMQSGDIDNRVASIDLDAMQVGTRLHKKIQQEMQKKYGSNYKSEVSLKESIDLEELILKVEGRADGILTEDDLVTIEEIKGTGREINKITKPESIHLAQAMCYAYSYSKQNEISNINIHITYCHLETEEIARFTESYSVEFLQEWFEDIINKYKKWALFQIEWKKIRNESIDETRFPFEYREGQKKLVAGTYRTIENKKKLFIQAPTGVGKTMAVLYPSIKAVGQGFADKIFYLTAKTITRTVAVNAIEILSKASARNGELKLKAIVLTAKDKICAMEEVQCNPEYCPYARGHYDRINDAVYETITTCNVLSREDILEKAKKWSVCPFELGLDISLWMDVIICDYNYVFDPNAHLKRFFGDSVKGEYLFLIDEAHNLVDRAREMYSAQIYKEDILRVKKIIGVEDAKLTKALEASNKKLLSLRKEIEDREVLPNVGDLYLVLTKTLLEMNRYFEERRGTKTEDEVLELYFTIRDFIYIYEKLDEHYVIYGERVGSSGFKVCLYCVNPAKMLSEYIDKGNSSIFFSATFLPINYYRELLSVEPDDYAIYAESPFDKKNRIIVEGIDVSTKYTRRSKDMYERYARYIISVAKSGRGNYIAFFPSYKFMEDVYKEFYYLVDNTLEYTMQSPYMSEDAREIFLENFEEERNKIFIGFCVMGGVFAEGIDLVEDKLIGAMIIGTGFPQVCFERELLKEYFDGKGHNGFDYAYRYPGMNKVLQAAGRVIRTETDKGLIALLDDRFSERASKEIFPREWSDIKQCKLNSIEGILSDFRRNQQTL
ncbi:MAG: ATP-dependent DNA helicase [Suipraeoptans sp.]